MRPWRWTINNAYKVVAQSIRHSLELFIALDRIEQTIDGYPQDGQFTVEDKAENIVRWHVAGYELLYERKVDTMHLLMANIQRN